MTKLTIVGDPHVVHKNIPTATLLCDQVENLGNECIWLGDMLDTKEIIRGRCLNFWLDYFVKSELQHYVIVGNHDWFNLECQDHSLRVLDVLDNVQIIDSPFQEECYDAVFIPYLHEPKQIKNAIKGVSDDAVIFAHLELKDFDFGNGRICEKGLTFKTFSRFDKVITGHFHKFQEKGNVTYLGTPYSLGFGEANQAKYLGIYDTETKDLELIETMYPKHIAIEINCDAENPEIPELRQEDYNRVTLIGTKENIALFDTNKLPEKTKVRTKPTDSDILDVDIDEDFTNLKKFTHWATDIKKLHKDTTEIGVDILENLGAK